MASTKISALTAASTLTGAETIPVVQGGVTKKVTTDQFLTKDASGNVGLGVTPSAWASGARAIDIGQYCGIWQDASGYPGIGFNAHQDGVSGWTYKMTGNPATRTSQTGGAFQWYTAPGGTAGNPISWTQAMKLDASGNLGVGVTPSAWGNVTGTLQLPDGSIFGFAGPSGDIVANAYYNAGYKFVKTGAASKYVQTAGSHIWSTAPSGTAGNAISFTQAMTLDASGNLGVGITPNALFRLDVNGNARISSAGAEGFEVQPGAITYVMAYNRNTAAYTPIQILGEYVSFSTGLGAERARIDSSGNLLVGDTSANGKLHVTNTNNVSGDTVGYFALGSNTNNASSYFLQCVTSGVGGKAYILGNGNLQNANNSYGAFSDVKLKENITDASPKLSKLMQVRIVNYTLKSDPDKTKLIGVVAQELEQVSPGLIEETADFEEVKKTREVTKSVPVTEQVTVQREQKTVEVVDGKAVVTVTLVDEQTAVPVVDQYPLFDADGQPVLEVDTPEVTEVLDEDGNVTQPAVPATYRQATHSVPRMQDVTETEEYSERVPLGTVTKSVKYSVFVPMLVKAVQEQQGQIEALEARLAALEAK